MDTPMKVSKTSKNGNGPSNEDANKHVSVVRYSADVLPIVEFARNIFESTCLCVSNLYSKTSVADVYDVFVRFGAIKYIKMYDYTNEMYKRYAYVYFESKVSAEIARKELHYKSTRLTYKSSKLFITYIDTVKARAKWYNYTAIASNACLYWRVYGKCNAYNEKRCPFIHNEVSKNADSSKFLKKTLEFEGFGPDSKRDDKRITFNRNYVDYFEEKTRSNYEYLMRNILKIELPYEDSVSNKEVKSANTRKTREYWDEDDVFIAIAARKKTMDVQWP